MTAEQLRNSILQEAISGRLVPQDPNDEPASVLLQHIREEKARLVKEKKLKAKDIVVTPITVDDIPYEIPNSWEWVRVKELFNVCSARRVHEKDWRSSGIPFYRAREIGKLAEFGHVDNDLYIDQELYNEFSKSGVPQENDLMVTAVGTLGRVYVVKANEIFYYKDGSVLCMENRFGINAKFAKLVIESPVFVSQYIGESQGTTVATLTMVRMNEYLLPLPPIAEQKRIVAKLEELLPIVEQYGKAQKELDELNAALPARLRQSILQAALQGNLVPQNVEDEPITTFLQRVHNQRESLLKEGKIKKKDYKIYNISEEEIPYELPQGWAWEKLGNLTQIISDGTHKTPHYVEAGVPFLSVQNISGGKLDLTKIKYITRAEHEDLIKRVKPQKGDLLICRIGTLGKAIKIYWDFEFSIFVSLGLIRLVDNCLADYIRLIINSPIGNSWIQENKVGGGTHTFKINLSDMPNMLLPLPPLAEQQRIVAKIEELFEQIDKITK